MAIGGIGVPNPNASQEASQPISNKQVQQLDLAIDTMLADLKELSKELQQGQATTGTKANNNAQTTNASLIQTQQKPSDQQVQAKPQDQNLLDKGKDGAAEVLAATAAAIEEEKEKELKFKRKRMSFQKKLDEMEKLEEVFSDVKLEDPEQQAQLDKFFQNMQTLRQLQNKLTQLDHQEEKYEEILKKQAQEAEMKEKAAAASASDTNPSDQKARAQRLDQILNDQGGQEPDHG